MFSLLSSSTDTLRRGRSESLGDSPDPLFSSPESGPLEGGFFFSSGSDGLKLSPLKISPLLQGSCVQPRKEAAVSEEPLKLDIFEPEEPQSDAPEPMDTSPLGQTSLHPVGEFFITDFLFDEQEFAQAVPETSVNLVVVRAPNYKPAIRVVSCETGQTFCWLPLTQCTLLVPLLESTTLTKFDCKFQRANSSQGVRLALLVRVSVDLSQKIVPRDSVEAASWASLATLTRTALFTSTPLSSSTSVSSDLIERPVSDERSRFQSLLDREAGEMSSPLPLVEPSPHLACTLHPHQKEGLAWFVSREVAVADIPDKRRRVDDDLPEGWERRFSSDAPEQPFYVNLATGISYLQHPRSRQAPQNTVESVLADDKFSTCSGGILADDMGLGKTVQMISLILQNRPADGPKTTLVVCPLSVMGQWAAELQRRVKAEAAVRVAIFHGPNRAATAAELADYDVVLTTYSTLSLEGESKSGRAKTVSKKRNRPVRLLLDHEWLRVILDEAHTIKDRLTKTAKVCYELKALHRWALTGTPVQNRLEELWSLLHFIRVPEPFAKFSWFNNMVLKPTSKGDERGLERLRELLDKVLLRRTKSAVESIVLPERRVVVEHLKFSPQERQIYDSLYSQSRAEVQQLLNTAGKFEGYSHVLVMLLRLRQCCDSPMLLVKEAEEVPSVCQNCMDVPALLKTRCSHSFCRTCIDRALVSECHICQQKVSALECSPVSPPTSPKRSSLQLEPSLAASANSTKIAALISHLKQIRDAPSAKVVKSVVFSQWTSMLALCATALRKHKFKFVRLEGSMTQQARTAAIESFNTDESITVFLISTKCGGQGLNLMRASRGFLMDPWWCGATENQAIDRIHRLGQKDDVLVTRFVIENTVEMDVLKLQESKFRLANQALSKDDLAEIFQLNAPQ